MKVPTQHYEFSDFIQSLEENWVEWRGGCVRYNPLLKQGLTHHFTRIE